MTFFCFVELSGSDTPHMEPLEASTLAEAEREARAMLRLHGDGVSATVHLSDQVVVVVESPPRAR